MRRIVQLNEGRRKAIKQFVLQILNTSLAVIIALSFEGLVEWRRIQQLVSTARAHMRGEISDNRKDLKSALPWVENIDKDRVHLMKFVEAVLAARAAGKTGNELPQASLGMRSLGLVLNATSRQTAEATGALGHMNYAEVKGYAETYSMQEEFMRIRAKMAEDQTRVLAIMRVNISQLPEPALQELRGTLLGFGQSLSEMKHYGKLLLDFYDRALAGPS